MIIMCKFSLLYEKPNSEQVNILVQQFNPWPRDGGLKKA
jgi:hypothetical protein